MKLPTAAKQLADRPLVRMAGVILGEEGDPAAPHVFWVRNEPGYVGEPHSHQCDYMEVILEGSQKVGKKWLYPGDARIVKGGTGYGPLLAGPNGVTFLVVFSSANWQPIHKGRAAAAEVSKVLKKIRAASAQA